MNLVEEFNMNDSLGLSGFVVITDNKTGKILLKKHNMILAGAKKVLLSKLLCACNNNDIEPTSKCSNLDITSLDLAYMVDSPSKYTYKDYYLKYCKFYNDENDVVYNENVNHARPSNTTTSNENDPFILEFILSESTANISPKANVDCTGSLTTSIEAVDNHYRLKFSIELSTDQEDPIKFTSLSLVMDHPNNSTQKKDLEIPFSRIKFDPIILTQESSLNLTYYVYF